MRTVPRIVLRALAETSGTARCTTSAGSEPDSAAAGVSAAAAGVEDLPLPGADRVTGGFALLGAESAAALFSAAAAVGFAAAGGALDG